MRRINRSCPHCGCELEWSTDQRDVVVCNVCNKFFAIVDAFHTLDDEIAKWEMRWNNGEFPDWMYEEDIIDYDDIPEGCQACGGPYPDCMTSCTLFDD